MFSPLLGPRLQSDNENLNFSCEDFIVLKFLFSRDGFVSPQMLHCLVHHQFCPNCFLTLSENKMQENSSQA